MKKIFLLVLLVSGCAIAYSQTKTIYTCPMHPKVQQDKPGKCPICGMSLVKKTIKAPAPKPAPKPPPKKETPKPDPKVVEPIAKDTIPNVIKDTTGKMDEHAHHQEEEATEEVAENVIQSRVNLIAGRTVRYDLYVKDTMVNFTG